MELCSLEKVFSSQTDLVYHKNIKITAHDHYFVLEVIPATMLHN